MDRIYALVATAVSTHIAKDCARLVVDYADITAPIHFWLPHLCAYVVVHGYDIYLLARNSAIRLCEGQVHFRISIATAFGCRQLFKLLKPRKADVCDVCGDTAIGALGCGSDWRSYRLFMCASCWQHPRSLLWICECRCPYVGNPGTLKYMCTCGDIIDDYRDWPSKANMGCRTNTTAKKCNCYMSWHRTLSTKASN